MKKLIAVAVVAMMILGTSVSAKEWNKIRVGVEGAYPPFSWVESDGTLKGFDIDIAMALCEEIGAECVLVPQDWDGIIPALLARKYDAIIASMSITEERKKKVAFSEKYYNTPAKFARKKGSGISISKAGMKGKKVGVQRATTHDNFITAEFGDSVEIKRYGTQDEAYLDAIAGRVDLLLADSIAMDDGFLKTDKGKGWEFVGPGYSDPKYFGVGAGIAVRKNNRDLADLFSKAIKTIRNNGVYKKINAKYFAFDVY
jgi:arginine/ornithine transport system substrate-binding protein